jgi:hypothetical protein
VAHPIAGHAGTGSVTAYTLASAEAFTLDTITFVVTTDATAGVHTVEVSAFSPEGLLIFRIPDWNDLAGSSTVTYTFGRGLTPFCGIVGSGGSVQNDLPFTELAPECSIVLRCVDSAGAVIGGDSFANVVLWASDATDAPDVIPLLTPLALNSQAAA